MAGIRDATNVRNIPPKPFGGIQEEWEEFAFKFRVYLNLTDSRFRALIRLAEAEGPEGTEVDDETLAINYTDYAQIITLTKHLLTDAPALMLRGMDTENGLVVWRALHQRYKQHEGSKALGQLRNILHPTFPESSFEDSFAKWEADVARYERERVKR